MTMKLFLGPNEACIQCELMPLIPLLGQFIQQCVRIVSAGCAAANLVEDPKKYMDELIANAEEQERKLKLAGMAITNFWEAFIDDSVKQSCDLLINETLRTNVIDIMEDIPRTHITAHLIVIWQEIMKPKLVTLKDALGATKAFLKHKQK